jgi:ABC-type transport system substrate-binding protein
MISTSGSGQMQPLPMNEFIQQSMKQCGFDITFEVVEWGAMLVAYRNHPTGPQAKGSDAMNISLVASDVSQMSRWFHPGNFAPNGSNWGHWKNPVSDAAWSKIDHAVDTKEMDAQIRIVHEQLVDDAPWLWIVHDLNPRAMSKKVKGFVSAQSWFQDFTKIDMP